MIQRWKKLGSIFCPSGEYFWLKSHAAVPIAEHIDGDFYRIYFSSRDDHNRSFTGYIVIDITKPHVILQLSKKPVLTPGMLGEFDDSGAMATWLAKHQDKKYLYYIGWNLGVTVPFRNSIGLSISMNDEVYSRYAGGPILDRSMDEPHFTGSCCVLPGNRLWQMWYLSCTDWRVRNNNLQHRYHIKYAESQNGLDWKREGIVSIDYSSDDEYAISRPSVIRDNDCYRMWYSFRGSFYRIGYAESEDGRKWVRLDQKIDLKPSSLGWDSEMIAYPFVFDHKGLRYMLYNGNGYGKTGIGMAILE